MDFTLLGENLATAESESTVKTYHCTSFKSWLLNLKSEGFLVVTNKRVVFHALGTSFAGKSILQSEVPIEDVSGITVYKGSYFSFWHLLGAFIFASIVGGIVYGVLGGIMAAIVNSVLKNATYQNLQQTTQSLTTITQILLWLVALGSLLVSFTIRKEKILRSTFASISVSAFIMLGTIAAVLNFSQTIMQSLSGEGTGTNLTGWQLFLAAIVGIYAIVCFFWYARRPTMSLSVGSKGGSSTPISISGVSSFGLYNTTASKALSAEPAEDAESLLQELGAMVMDIQTLGDLGVQKWQAG
jgi:hypothetical protein